MHHAPFLLSARRCCSRRAFLGTAAAGLANRWARGQSVAASSDNSSHRAARYLFRQQGDDGGWHSPQYGVMRSGQALTPFVMWALMSTIDSLASDDAGRLMRAARFIMSRLTREGVLGRFDPELVEYPVYSTAYALLSFRRLQSYHRLLGRDGDDAIARMQAYLLAAQYDEDTGFGPKDAAYGGWGLQEALVPGKSGHMDLAHTRRALEALQAGAGQRELQGAQRRARKFLALVQKRPEADARQPAADNAPRTSNQRPPAPPFDGGFYFSPVVTAANKGRLDEHPAPHWRSYATATCDGALALLAAGVPRDDPRVTAAARWLTEHADVDYPQGVPAEYPEPWGEAIRFYHYAVRAEAYRALKFPAAERAKLAAAVAARQRADGSFVNDNPLMKEDDPVLCTALGTIALANCAA
jgi:squalene-hopene/tetraprenyl-beta-curcumene cyclase